MFLRSLHFENLLSFRDTRLDLSELTILIGPNGAGKSNLIDAIGLLQAAPKDLNRAIVAGGGASAWSWKGINAFAEARLSCTIEQLENTSLLYELGFISVEQTLVIQRERLLDAASDKGLESSWYLDRDAGKIRLQPAVNGARGANDLPADVQIRGSESFLATYRNPMDPTPITWLGRQFENIRIYREFQTGPNAQARSGISSAARKDYLEEDGSNLAAVLSELDFKGELSALRKYLREFSDRFIDIKTRLHSGAVQVYLEERGLSEKIPGTRLSDGTLKLLCLLAVLLNPNPASLICIEEPEIGLHPDALKIVGDVLKWASTRMQLVVTTHSEALIDALSDRPQSVVICERDFDDSTQFRRLPPDQMADWLEHYSLGELWRRGEIGGNRW